MSILERWDAWWFPESTGFRLAVCRVIVVATTLLFFFPSLDWQIVKLVENDAFIRPQWLIVVLSVLGPDDVLFSPGAFQVLYVLTIVSGIACLIGLFTRSSAFLFALSIWILWSHQYSYGEEHHGQAVAGLFLMLLALSPSGRRLSVDAVLRRSDRNDGSSLVWTTDTTIWPIKLTQVVLAWSYFSNGLAKLAYGGLEWMNGYTLQQYLLREGISGDRPLGLWLAEHHSMAILASIGTIVFELFFFLAVVFPRTAPLILVGGVLLHTGIYLTMSADFFQQMVMYVIFLDFERWETWWQKHVTSWMGPMGAWARSGAET